MVVVMCNASPEQAPVLARTVVEEGLAACVNLVPVRSVYRWQGEVHEDHEVAMWIKASTRSLAALRKRIVELHDYELPEVVVLPVDVAGSHGPYVQWVRDV